MNEHFEHTASARIAHDQISVCVKDNSLGVTQAADENHILICGEHMDGIIAERDDKNIAARICDNVIRDGEIRDLFQGAILLKAKDRVAIFVSDEQVPARFHPRAGGTHQPGGKLLNALSIGFRLNL